MKLNSAENYEPLDVIKVTKEKFPIAFKNKIDELLSQGEFKTREDAEKIAENFEIELELYYHKDYGFFAVESEAVESGTIYSPYSGELCEEYKEE